MSTVTPNLADTLLAITDGMDRAAEEIAFIAHGLATSHLDTSLGACWLLDRIRDQLQGLSREALAALKANPENPDEGQPHA